MAAWTPFAQTRDAHHTIGITRSLRLEIIAAYHQMQALRRRAAATPRDTFDGQFADLAALRAEQQLRRLLRIRREGIIDE